MLDFSLASLPPSPLFLSQTTHSLTALYCTEVASHDGLDSVVIHYVTWEK